jgi:hypothetical protein
MVRIVGPVYRSGQADCGLLAEQAASWQCLLTFARPQRCIRATLKPLAQARRLVKVKQPLTDLVNAGRGLRQCPPFASRDNDL